LALIFVLYSELTVLGASQVIGTFVQNNVIQLIVYTYYVQYMLYKMRLWIILCQKQT